MGNNKKIIYIWLIILLLPLTSFLFFYFVPRYVETRIEDELTKQFPLVSEKKLTIDHNWFTIWFGQVDKLIIETGPIEIKKIPFSKAKLEITKPRVNLQEYISTGTTELRGFEKADLFLWLSENDLNEYLHQDGRYPDWSAKFEDEKVYFVYNFQGVKVFFDGQIKLVSDYEVEFQSKEIAFNIGKLNKKIDLGKIVLFYFYLDNLPLNLKVKRVVVDDKLLNLKASSR